MSHPPPGSPAPSDPPRPPDPAGQPVPPLGPPPQQGPPPVPPPGVPPTAFRPGVASPAYPQPEPVYPPTTAFPGQPPGMPGAPPPGMPGAPPPYGPAPLPARRGRSNTTLWVLIAVFAVLLSAGGVVAVALAYRNSQETPTTIDRPSATVKPPPTSAPTPSAAPSRAGAGGGVVTYEVTGDGPVEIRYQTTTRGASKRVHGAALPWRTEVTMDGDVFMVSLFVARTGSAPGSVTCRVLVDGAEVVTRTSDGPRAVAACIKINIE